MSHPTSMSKRSSDNKLKAGRERLKGFVESGSEDEFDGFKSDGSFHVNNSDGSGSDTDSYSGSSGSSNYSSSDGDSDGSYDSDDSQARPTKRGRKSSPNKSPKSQPKKQQNNSKGGVDLADIDRLTAELGGDVGDGRTNAERRASADLDALVDNIKTGQAKANAKRKRNGQKGNGKGAKNAKGSKSKNKPKSRSTSRMSKDDHPDSLRESMRPDELSLLDDIMADLEEDKSDSKLRRSKRSRKPPRRYIDRRDVRKDVQKHYMKKLKPESMDAYIKLLQEDVEEDPLMDRFVKETEQFSSDEGYDTEEERIGRSKKRPFKSGLNGSDSESSGSESDDASSVDSLNNSRNNSPTHKSPKQRFGTYPTSVGI